MKKITAIITLFIISNVLYSQSNGLYVEKKVCLNAIEYNDYIVDLVVLTGNAWSKAMDATNLSTAMKANKDLKSLSGKIIISLGKLQGYEGDVNFKNSAINYITHMNKLIYGKGTLTPEREKQAEALIPMLDDKRESLFKEIEISQANFAAQHNFTIEGNN
jgi:hypothetical protein